MERKTFSNVGQNLLLTVMCSFCALGAYAQIDGSYWWLDHSLKVQHGDRGRIVDGENLEAREPKNIEDSILTDNYLDEHTVSFENCTCVPYFLCDDNINIITDGNGIIEPRSKEPADRVCDSPFLICCRVPDLQNASSTSTNGTNTPQKLPKTPHKSNNTLKCGKSIPQLASRIVFDEGDEEFGQFPWMLALLSRNSNNNYRFHCGATLIHPRVGVTAGHCISGISASELLIHAGSNEWDQNSSNKRAIKYAIRHPKYYSGGLHYDASVLIWEAPLQFTTTSGMNAICLPSIEDEMEGRTCRATGWGKTHRNSRIEHSHTLKKVDLPIIPSDKCEDLLKKTRLGRRFNLHTSFICAGGQEGADTCQGDGGGPLACPVHNSDQYFLGGIVSWGIGCGDAGNPGLYTNVPSIMEWIRLQMAIHSIT